MSQRKKHLLVFLSLLYGALMLYLLFFRREPRCWEMSYAECLRTGMELELFRATKRYLYIARYDLTTALIYLGGNILCFVPLGWLLELRLRHFGKTLAAAFTLILAVETLQYITTLGFFDIDDFVFNLFGVFLGWLWRRLGRK